MRRCRCQTAVRTRVVIRRCEVYLMPTRQIKTCGTAWPQLALDDSWHALMTLLLIEVWRVTVDMRQHVTGSKATGYLESPWSSPALCSRIAVVL